MADRFGSDQVERALAMQEGSVLANEVLRLRAELEELRAEDHELHGAYLRLRHGLEGLQHLHRRSDDDPAGPPYCPECQAYDGTGQPCETLRVVDGLLGTPAPEVP